MVIRDGKDSGSKRWERQWERDDEREDEKREIEKKKEREKKREKRDKMMVRGGEQEYKVIMQDKKKDEDNGKG